MDMSFIRSLTGLVPPRMRAGESDPGPAPRGRAPRGHLRGRNIAVLTVDSGGCGLTRSELRTLLAPRYALERHGLCFVDAPPIADILLVTGPVTTAMEPELTRLYATIPEPKWVMTVGDCTRNGCAFQGSYAVAGGLGGLIPVDVHVPGCPPRPEAILEGLLRVKFAGAIETRVAAE